VVHRFDLNRRKLGLLVENVLKVVMKYAFESLLILFFLVLHNYIFYGRRCHFPHLHSRIITLITYVVHNRPLPQINLRLLHPRMLWLDNVEMTALFQNF